MPRPKGSQNKLTTEVKERLQNILDDALDSIDLNDMNVNQKLKFIQLGLQYIIPKLQSTTIHPDDSEIDKPLFIEIYDRKDGLTDETESDVWKDNFEVVERQQVGAKNVS